MQSGAPQLPGDLLFRGELVATAMQKVCDAVGWNWYVDVNKDIHFYATETSSGPQSLTTSNYRYALLENQSDLNQIRTRANMVGGGAKTTAAVAIGAATTPVDECAWYTSTGGTFVSGPNIITYTGLSATSGPGNITGCSGNFYAALKQGDTCTLLVSVDDTSAQAALAIIEGGDGIHEYWEENPAWTITAAAQAASASVSAFRVAEIRGTYETLDKSTRVGQQVPIVLTSRNITSVVTLQRVTRRLIGPYTWHFKCEYAVVWSDFIDIVTRTVTPN